MKCLDSENSADCDYLRGDLCGASKKDRQLCEKSHKKMLEMLKQCRRVR